MVPVDAFHLASQTALNWYWLWHPLQGPGYQFWSGIASDAGEITLVGGLVIWWSKHNCHEHRCWRLSWHPDAEGHPICKKHHPDHPSKGWFRNDKNHPRHAAQKRKP